MKTLQSLFVLAMVLPLGLCGQQSQMSSEELFFYNLAIEDARLELNQKLSSVEDERDFWKDQKAFEKALKKKDIKVYNAYLRYKGTYYKEHISNTKFLKGWSEVHAAQIAIYLSKVPEVAGPQEVIALRPE